MFKTKNSKIPAFWFLGALCILFASMIAGNVSIDSANFLIAVLLALVLILLGGLLWISVAIAVKHVREEVV